MLIPRPETEHVVEEALAVPLPERPWILDVGTGSGILPVTLAAEFPAADGGDRLSPGALAVAPATPGGMGSDRARFTGADLAHGLDLPLRPDREQSALHRTGGCARALPEVVDFEPHLALFATGSGDGGTAPALRRLQRAPARNPRYRRDRFRTASGSSAEAPRLLPARAGSGIDLGGVLERR